MTNTTMDLLFRLRGPLHPPQEVVIIGIDEPSLQHLGPWPFPRAFHARLLERLSEARAIGFDFLFSETTDDDLRFSRQLKHAPPVVLATATASNNRLLLPAPGLRSVTRTGHVETLFDGDGMVRKIDMHHPVGQLPFALTILRASGWQGPTPDAETLYINYYGPEKTFLFLSYIDVLKGKIPRGFFADRLVLIGAETIGLHDTFITPLSRTRVMPGVEIQATILSNLLEDSLIRSAPQMSLLLAASLITVIAALWQSMGERFNVSVILTAAGAAILLAYFCFRASLFIDISSFMVALFSAYLFHLLLQALWTAGAMYRQIRFLNKRLDKGLQRIYSQSPHYRVNVEQQQSLPDALGIGEHINQLQQASRALGMQHAFLDNLLHNELPPLVLWDAADNSPIFANIHFRNFWQQQQNADASLPDYQSFSDHLALSSPLTDEDDATPNAPGTHRPLRTEIHTLSSSGRQYFQVDIHHFTVTEPPFQGIMAILHDVTKLRELERVKGEIVSIVSHELKLPLTTILGYGEMLADIVEKDQQPYAEAICAEAKRLNQLIVAFLDINRIESGKQQIHPLPFHPLAIIGDAINSATPAADKKDISITTTLPKKTSPLVGDELLLLQALINLLDNAVKFSPCSSTITVSLEELVDHFAFAVTDQGPGIAPELRDTIFTKFYRGEKQPTQEGFGLGLSLVKEVVERHSGQVTIHPETNGGTIFTLLIPKALPVKNTPPKHSTPKSS